MPTTDLWAGALSLLLRHNLTGCTHSARQAAAVLDRISSFPELDDETRTLCEQASFRLTANLEFAPCRPCPN